nr:methyltransferase domain-containing protein [Nocardioides flavescens]
MHEPCPDCGYDAAAVDRRRIGELLRADALGWTAVLALPRATRRPDDSTWSALEYACHVRDVHRTMAGRLALLLAEDDPTFADWDQDATAVEEGYDRQDPAVVGPEVLEAAEAAGSAYDALRDADESTWSRRGRRSNGSVFTVDTLARYHLHDVVHHAHDVRRLAVEATRSAYDADAGAYAEVTARVLEEHAVELDSFAARVGARGAVLEIGSGGGRDARALEARGLRVRRTDVSPGFVERLVEQGHDAVVLDPLTDDLGGPWDGVWAQASLLHVARDDLPLVLGRLAGATRPGGELLLGLKEGHGERWSVHGRVRAPRWFTFWTEEQLRAVLDGAGWDVSAVRRSEGSDGQPWLTIRASRRGDG